MSKIGEDRQIALKQQLLQFRESDQTELAFPSTLTNLERKFIHKTATELGLISNSSGIDEKRFITVRKKNAATNAVDKRGPIPWSLSTKSLQALTSADLQSALKEVKDAIKAEEERDPTSLKHVIHRHGFQKLHDVRQQLASNHRAAEAKRRNHPEYESIHEKRHLLPASHHRIAVCKMVQEHQIVLVSGETGCGKSTQVPQFLLDSESHGPTSRIIITQPRRISAVSLAERIAYERCEQVGESVGYNIRFEHKLGPNSQLIFVTPGVLLRKLLTDPDLEEFSHVIVDEAHERDRFTEFLLILLRDLCARRKAIHLVLMSATMHTEKLRNYFGEIPQINVGGSVFPVQEFFLEHVLKFTNFLSQQPSARNSYGGSRGGGLNHAKSLSSLQKNTTGFRCSICQAGPFLSPEELGTHAAFCFGENNGADSAQKAPQRRHSFEDRTSRLNEVQEKVEIIRRTTKPFVGFESDNAPPNNPSATVNFSNQVEEIEIVQNDAEDDAGSDVSFEGWVEEEGDSAFDDLTDPTTVETDKALLSEEMVEFQGLVEAYQKQTVQNDDKSVDTELIIALLRFVLNSEFGRDGTVLVFLPGWDDISSLYRSILNLGEFQDSKRFLVLQLHSGIPKKDQQLVFQPAVPGQRKIVLSTNIAETSLTIDDVSVVIDSGLAKEKTYDPHTKLSYLKVSYISQAAARQRKGRAGRTRSGVCFRLYSLLRSKHLSEFQDSELLRMPLEELVLQAKSLGVAPGSGDDANSVKSFLLKSMDPPSSLSIQHGIDLLQNLQCLDNEEGLTRLGEVLAHLPMNPRIGRMLLLGCVLGCGPAVVAVGAIMSYRDPFLMPTDEAAMARASANRISYSQQTFADPLATHHVLEEFNLSMSRYGQSEARQYCDGRDLSFGIMQQLKALASELDYNLQDIGINSRLSRSVAHNGHLFLIATVLSTGLYPNFALRRQGAKLFTTETGAKSKIHPSSINARSGLYRNECRAAAQILCFTELTEISPHSQSYSIGGANYMMRSTAPLNFLTLLLTCGELQELPTEEVESDTVVIQVDHWINLQLKRSDYELILGWRDFMSQAVLAFVEQLSTPSALANEENMKRLGKAGNTVGIMNATSVVRAIDRLVIALETEQHVCVDSSAK